MPTPDAAVSLIASQSDLEAACAVIASRPELPLDTEFVRTDTYRPRLCLMQIGTPDVIFCLDMIADIDPAPLWRAISTPGALKILHAAKQDMEVFLLRFGSLPGPLFDTQIAAALLGHPPQMGYAALVEAELGIHIDKTQTRTDWSRRPLTPAQIAYAANDVAFLTQLTLRLRERLAALGREEWAVEDSAALLEPVLYGVHPEKAWERLGGITYQPVATQVRARRLAAWRERRADQADRPRQWILSDQALLALAAAGPTDVAGIRALDVMPAGAMRNSAEAILAELRRADAEVEAGGHGLVRRSRPKAADDGHLRYLIALVQKAASALDLAPEIIATRGELTALLRGERDLRPLRGWRRAVIGEALLGALPESAERAY
jgi:ribonuclease D